MRCPSWSDRSVWYTVWHCKLTLKLLWMLPDRHMVHFIVERIADCSFVHTALCSRPATDSKADYAEIRTVSPRDLFWPHCCSISTSMTSKKYGYADNLAILTAHREWKKIESTLSQDMSTLALYLRQWWLKLSEGKTVSTVFHLNNKEEKRKLDVYMDTRYSNFQPTTT